MEERLLAGERRPSSAWEQALTLVWSKEVSVKRANWKTTLAELVLPSVLCAIMIVGVLASTVENVDARDYAPTSLVGALATAVLPGWLFSGNLPADLPVEMPPSSGAQNLTTPGWVPPLWLYLLYASGTTELTVYRSFPPYAHGGSAFAVVPDSAAARAVIEPMLVQVHAAQCDFAAILRRQKLSRGAPPRLRPLYLSSEALLEARSYDGDPFWAAIVFHGLPEGLELEGGRPDAAGPDAAGPHDAAARGGASGSRLTNWSHSTDWSGANWSYTLRFNASHVPPSSRLFDRFPSGLSTKYFKYYSSGFVSLQQALNHRILELATLDLATRLDPPRAPAAYGVPFPVAAYSHNPFFNFAGNLIGILVIFSLLVPLSTLLRSVVLERETKLKEQLLIMGTRCASVYVISNYANHGD